MLVKLWIFVLGSKQGMLGHVKHQFAYEIKMFVVFYQKPFRGSGAAFLKLVEGEKCQKQDACRGVFVGKILGNFLFAAFLVRFHGFYG